MNTKNLIETISKCVWIGDKNIMNSNIYLNRKAVLDALFNGTFYTDCANFVNLVNYLTTESEYMHFQLRCGVYSIKNARYCGSKTHVLVTNKCKFHMKGQWIIEIDGSWYGMTELGVTTKTLEEWLEFAKNLFINAAKGLNLSDLRSDPWVAHTCMELNHILSQEPTLAQKCMIMGMELSNLFPSRSVDPTGMELGKLFPIPSRSVDPTEVKKIQFLPYLPLNQPSLKPTYWKNKKNRVFSDGRRELQKKRFK
jgi:hypothetical protein